MQAANSSRIPFPRLMAYGVGGIIPIALFNIAGQFIGLIGNIGLGLSAFWLGVILIIPRLWDAFSDPMVGHYSDNFRSKLGRRRPFLLVGGILVAVGFCLMWWVPEAVEEWVQLLFILFFLLVFFTACTLFEIPHGALGMEMSSDTHERTRLFSAKSFFGNLFAMGTPWLYTLANMEAFKGVGGNEADGMKWVSLIIAAILIPLSIWWFMMCKEPALEQTRSQKRERFLPKFKETSKNGSFVRLVIIIFTLAMGFNFVGLLNYYISIFYLYGGDKVAAGPLLGINGTIWGLTGLLAVFPLNVMSKRLGKKQTLSIAILLMAGAQLSKIYCYNPAHPYLVIIPTVLLSAGMLMFFTLGSSMLGDVCDEDELKTGTRTEGTYYSIYWWFIKLGTAFASFVTGVLITFSHFDETQTTKVDDLSGSLAQAIAQVEASDSPEEHLNDALDAAITLYPHFGEQAETLAQSEAHYFLLQDQVEEIIAEIEPHLGDPDAQNKVPLSEIKAKASALTQQSPSSLLRLRVLEIGLPLLLCLISLWLLKFYPITEARSQEVKRLLEERRAG